MKHPSLLLIATLALFILGSPAPHVSARDFPPNGAPKSFADIVENLVPAVVNISSTQKIDQPQDFPELPQFPEGSPFEDFFDEFMNKRGRGAPAVPATSLGSGFVIDAENGYIVTNSHVIKDAEKVRVTFQDELTVDAQIIGSDEKTDLAVLKVKTSRKLSQVDFGNSDVLRVGDWIIAIGNPFGLGGTVTAGIVSARQRDIQSGPYDDFIQTDASINRGNSGGPMFDTNGKVIGINTAIFSPSGGSVGIGFAIPSALAKPVIDQIIQYGRTRRGWLGVRIQKVTDEIAESLEMEKPHGALVATITQDGPSEKAGLEIGDIITAFNGKKIAEMKDLPRLVASTPINAKATVTLWRNGKSIEKTITVGELEKAEEDGLLAAKPRSEASGTKIQTLGFTVEPLSEQLRDDFDIDNSVKGLAVTSLTAGSQAEEKGIIEGDVIVEVNQQAITKPSQMLDIIKKAANNNRSSVLLLVNRAGDMRFIALKISE